jgi:phage tail tube protein FII
MGQKLLREYYELCEGGICQDLLTEAEKKFVAEGGMILTGKLQEGGIVNGNKRMYPPEVIIREVNSYKKLVAEKRALGELDHPDNNVVSLERVSHRVTDIWMDGNVAMGKVQVLNTPAGKILQELVNGGCKMGISSRGMGSVREEKEVTIVEDDFQLICFDFVSEPSTPNAFMMQESKNFQNKLLTEEDKINRLMNDILINELVNDEKE